ncbi:MAG: DUF423 domain-containing protein [Aeromonadaceae bacterium]
MKSQVTRNRGLVVTGIFGMTAVAMGAFAAHALKTTLDSSQLALIQTAVHYQLWHTLALGLSVLLASRGKSRPLSIASWCFGLGIPLFSGSLYLLALTAWPVGIITPLGGLLLIAGWGALALQGWRGQRHSTPLE